jgi:hypothetical protein
LWEVVVAFRVWVVDLFFAGKGISSAEGEKGKGERGRLTQDVICAGSFRVLHLQLAR